MIDTRSRSRSWRVEIKTGKVWVGFTPRDSIGAYCGLFEQNNTPLYMHIVRFHHDSPLVIRYDDLSGNLFSGPAGLDTTIVVNVAAIDGGTFVTPLEYSGTINLEGSQEMALESTDMNKHTTFSITSRFARRQHLHLPLSPVPPLLTLASKPNTHPRCLLCNDIPHWGDVSALKQHVRRCHSLVDVDEVEGSVVWSIERALELLKVEECVSPPHWKQIISSRSIRVKKGTLADWLPLLQKVWDGGRVEHSVQTRAETVFAWHHVSVTCTT